MRVSGTGPASSTARRISIATEDGDLLTELLTSPVMQGAAQDLESGSVGSLGPMQVLASIGDFESGRISGPTGRLSPPAQLLPA